MITTPLTFFATATCAMWQGAEIVFADVSPDTGNLDPESVAERITERTKVVAGVDYAGHPIDAPALRLDDVLAARFDLFLTGAEWQSREIEARLPGAGYRHHRTRRRADGDPGHEGRRLRLHRKAFQV